LGLDELSSGEQELATLTAGLLLARSAIVALEEPEMGLDYATQGLWRGICERQLAAGFLHQLIIESHSVTFDGARVVRFRRDENGSSRVETQRSHVDDPLTERACEQGAEEVFVTRDGYTRLPEPMRSEMRVGDGGAHVWFLRGVDTWEAWPEDKLDAALEEREK
jgi:hypothetical protein